MRYQDIYDFEGIVEGAISAVFIDGGVTALTSISDPELQKERPRVEVVYSHGAGMNRFVMVTSDGSPAIADDPYPFRRESAWRGSLKIDVITEANPVAHRAFRSKVRSMMANIWTAVNETHLPNHKLQFASDGGTTPTYDSTKGFYVSSLLYNTDLSVQADAWSLLANE